MQYHVLPFFKDDRQYDCWYCETHAIAIVHGTETVLDPIIALQKLSKLDYG